MGMDTNIVGYREADDKFNAMKEAYLACVKAGIEIPDEVEEFFDDKDPTDMVGQEVSISDSLEEWEGRCASGYEVDIDKLPKNLKKIRFYTSW